MRDTSSGLSTALAASQDLTSDIVKASWRRCLAEYGLDRATKKPIERLSSSATRDLRERMQDVLVEASPVVENVRRVAADANHVILLSNADGVVVTSFADSHASRELAREGLETGSIWQEERVGTNGIGTSLVSRQPITVFGGAHFNENFSSFTCSAAPIFAPDGSVLGAFDISGRAIPGSNESNFAQYFAREAAAQISLMLFRKWHRNDCIVAISPDAEPMPMSVKALLATDENGRILGATPEAFSYLGAPDLSDIAGRHVHDIWNVSFNDLRPLSKYSVRLRTSDGTATFVTAFMPKKKSSSPGVRSSHVIQDRKSRQQPTTRALDRVAGDDPGMQQNIALCRKIIDKDIPLLILGETGVGKDTLARAIHMESARANKPYVAVNCAAIPATLLASELFGYAPGTFTGGAKGGRIGKILASHGGTLFLDEIGDMPLELQAHLLRILEERTVTPLGTSEAVPVDMKIICATHRNLHELIDSGEFRKDLYYRIRGAQIMLPCLRERKDIAQLVRDIVKDELGEETTAIDFTDAVLDLFRRYPWPGNIRELRNVLRFVTSLHGGKLVDVGDLPDQLLDFSRCGDASPPIENTGGRVGDSTAELGWDTPATGPAPTTLQEANEIAERRRIVEALRTNRWNVTEAAGQLGISRATLHRKIRRHEITSPNNQS